MKERRTTCLYCGEEMVAKSAKRLFCDTACRVYFNREKPQNGGVKILTTATIAPKTLAELKSKCPKGLDMLDRAKWIQDNRLKYGI